MSIPCVLLKVNISYILFTPLLVSTLRKQEVITLPLSSTQRAVQTLYTRGSTRPVSKFPIEYHISFYMTLRDCHLSQSSRGLHLPLLKVLCTEENSARIKVAISALFNSTATKAYTLALHYLPHLTPPRGEQKVNLREQHNYFYPGLRITIEDKLFRISLASTLKLRLTKPKIFKSNYTSTSC